MSNRDLVVVVINMIPCLHSTDLKHETAAIILIGLCSVLCFITVAIFAEEALFLIRNYKQNARRGRILMILALFPVSWTDLSQNYDERPRQLTPIKALVQNNNWVYFRIYILQFWIIIQNQKHTFLISWSILFKKSVTYCRTWLVCP